MKAPPRLFVEDALCADQKLILDREASHYVQNVMRRRVGDALRLFNGRDGEWLAHIESAERKTAQLRVTSQSRPMVGVPDLFLLFAPVKKARSEFIIEKATELGARTVQPVITMRTIAKPLRDERMALISREAAEQTERLDLPTILPHAPLENVLKDWDENRLLFFCDEEGAGAGENKESQVSPLRQCLQDLKREAPDVLAKSAILIGPEGGFAPQERDALRQLRGVRAVTLGPRILRADTAAVAAMSVWQSVCGDW